MFLRSIKLCLVLLCLFWPALVWAQETQPPQALPSFGGLLLQVTLSLALVCALAYGALRFGLARMLTPKTEEGQSMEVLQTMQLGARRNMMLVRIHDRVLVIGSSEAGLQTLADLGPGSAQKEPPSSFEEALERTKKPHGEEPQGSLSSPK